MADVGLIGKRRSRSADGIPGRDWEDMEAEEEDEQREVYLKILVSEMTGLRGLKEFDLKDYYEQFLLTEMIGFVEISDTHISPSFGAPYEHRCMEYHARLKPNGMECENTLQFARWLTRKWCEESALGCRLNLKEPQEAYFNSCISCHEDVDLESFSLGNFLNWQTYLDHFSETKRIYNPNRADQRRGGQNQGKPTMYCKFEHDRKLLAVFFYRQESVHGRMGYKLVTGYDNIRVLVSDLDRKRARDAFCIYMEIRSPPELWQTPGTDENFRNLDKCKNWIRLGEVSEDPNYMGVLANCSVLCLRFPPSKNVEDDVALIHELIGRMRLRLKTRISIFFAPVETVEPKKTEMEQEDFLRDLIRYASSFPAIRDQFPVFYALEALLRRGYRVKDQLCGEFGNTFIRLIALRAKTEPELTQKALENLMGAVDDLKTVEMLTAFEKLFDEFLNEDLDIRDTGSDLSSVYDSEGEQEYGEVEGEENVAERRENAEKPKKSVFGDLPEKCVRVRKVAVTPTRMHFLVPEVMMGNRVLRTFGEEFALRCVFRDEDGRKITHGAKDKLLYGDDEEAMCERDSLIRRRVKKIFDEGVTIGGRHFKFLAWSNSQMRDFGLYLYAEAEHKDTHQVVGIADIRKWMGDFTAMRNVPKRMSRMAQCFTQAQNTITLESWEYTVEKDIVTKGRDHVNRETGERYIFSDGIGTISIQYAVRICRKLKIDPVPSAFQVRFAGFKGMLSVDKRLPDAGGHHVIFRESMKKFDGGTSIELEIVKYSMPASVYLNRPLIMILDQDEDMFGFFLKYMFTDAIGQISVAHLIMADLLGIYSDTCMDIAKKCSLAVDFPKTGAYVPPLEPSERPKKYPDYHPKDHKPVYRSKRLLGVLFRKIKKVDDIILRGRQSIERKLDRDLETSGWRQFREEAKQARDRYFLQIQAILDTYGIADEASMISGHIVDIRNRISDHEKEDFSFYNTDSVVEMRYKKIFQNFREEFFQGLQDNLEGVVENPTDRAMDKASAWYMVTYGGTDEGNMTEHLSFPWIVWDILAYIKRERVYGKGLDVLVTDPIMERLLKAMEYQCEYYKEALDAGAMELCRRNDAVRRYCERYSDLKEIFFVLGIWKDRELNYVSADNAGYLTEIHLYLLYIKFCLDRLESEKPWDWDMEKDKEEDGTEDEGIGNLVLLPYISEKVDSVEEAWRRNESDRHGLSIGYQKAESLLQFIKYLASEKFLNDDNIDLGDLNDPTRPPYMFEESLRKPVNTVAFKTYQDISLSHRFSSLHLREPEGGEVSNVAWDYGEMEPKMVELESEVFYRLKRSNKKEDLKEMLKKMTRLDSVDVRATNVGKNLHYLLIIGAGKAENREKLEEILTEAEKFNEILSEVLADGEVQRSGSGERRRSPFPPRIPGEGGQGRKSMVPRPGTSRQGHYTCFQRDYRSVAVWEKK